jgi:predicted enzyme related to lactoylglutathione lyase
MKNVTSFSEYIMHNIPVLMASEVKKFYRQVPGVSFSKYAMHKGNDCFAAFLLPRNGNQVK